MWRVQLQTNHPVESSARRSHLVESSATKQPSCREFSYKETTMDVESLAANKSSVESSAHFVESSATKKPSCREFSYKETTMDVESLAAIKSPVESSARNKSPCREIS